ncbi:hypothetical protein BDW22DRAFT_1431645 [Trametopsis cervina]|nr:hypothetical protein BDW22DRAFT_1431645 [Trametopsis cervina]
MSIKRNGFTDPATRTMSLTSAVLPVIPSTLPPRELRDAVALHRQAEQLLDVKGSYGPSLATMKAELAAPVPATTRLAALKTRHETEASALLDRIAADYIADATDEYHATDDAIVLPELTKFHTATTHIPPPGSSTYTSHHYAHLQTTLALHRQRLAEAAAQRRRDAAFPASVAAYRAESKEVQARVARFLVAGASVKERMLQEFGWVYRQVRPLEEVYGSDTAFMAEVQRTARGDPRRKAQ